MLHAADYLAPDSVLTVQEAGIVKADEKLAVGGVRIISPRHRANAAHMWLCVKFLLQIWLGGTSHACAIGAATLRHEARNYAVKLYAIVKAFAGKFGDASDVIGRQIRTQLDYNVAAVERKGKCLIGHIEIPLGV
jgi:hypothetical protein